MSRQCASRSRLNPEKVAYWYFRLNGFLQIENFYVHPNGRGSARTDADLLAVRFPYRAERLLDNPNDIMQDDVHGLRLTQKQIDVAIVEIKTGRCALNGPWTEHKRKNVHRVLAAIGCLSEDRISSAAKAIYEHGYFCDDPNLRLRIISVGSRPSEDITRDYPSVTQILWHNLLEFTFCRLRRFRHQKRQTENWDCTGKRLKAEADRNRANQDDFISWALDAMGVTAGNQIHDRHPP